MTPISIFLEIPEKRKAQAQFAFEMLLKPLKCRPVFLHNREDLNKGLYYGTQPQTSPEVLHLPYIWPEDDLPNMRLRDLHYRVVPVVYTHEQQYDVVSSAFFWLADVQSRLLKERDVHGRLRYDTSFQAKWGVEPLPFADEYRLYLQSKMHQRGLHTGKVDWLGHPFAACMTHDIDHLYKWTLRRWWKEKRPKAALFQRMDGYEKGLWRLLDVDERWNLKATWFFKGGANAPEDHYYPLHAPAIQNLFQKIVRAKHEIGLHPAYFTHAHPAYFQKETANIRQNAPTKVTSVRQHYLRWDHGHTPQLQQKNGFRLDAGMSFVDRDGFRNGTCLPFRLFDLCKNEVTSVWEMPLCLHDTTLMQYRNLNTHEAIERTQYWLDLTKRYNGVLVGLWHNVIYDTEEYPDWATHFEASAKAFGTSGAWCPTLDEALTAFLTP